jgi:choline dehydrogenase-like flavoprotein
MRQSGWHLMGTARMGEDSSNSVVDKWGQAHDVDNLFIIDGSVFVTGAAVNPTPTIQALALRTADYIIANRNDLKG